MSYVDTCENSRLITVSHELEKATLLGGFFLWRQPSVANLATRFLDAKASIGVSRKPGGE